MNGCISSGLSKAVSTGDGGRGVIASIGFISPIPPNHTPLHSVIAVPWESSPLLFILNGSVPSLFLRRLIFPGTGPAPQTLKPREPRRRLRQTGPWKAPGRATAGRSILLLGSSPSSRRRRPRKPFSSSMNGAQPSAE